MERLAVDFDSARARVFHNPRELFSREEICLIFQRSLPTRI
jgi:hypothetical protein